MDVGCVQLEPLLFRWHMQFQHHSKCQSNQAAPMGNKLLHSTAPACSIFSSDTEWSGGASCCIHEVQSNVCQPETSCFFWAGSPTPKPAILGRSLSHSFQALARHFVVSAKQGCIKVADHLMLSDAPLLVPRYTTIQFSCLALGSNLLEISLCGQSIVRAVEVARDVPEKLECVRTNFGTC